MLRDSHRHPRLGEKILHIADRVLIEVENAGRQRRIGVTFIQNVENMLWRTRAAAGDNGNLHRIADGVTRGIEGLGVGFVVATLIGKDESAVGKRRQTLIAASWQRKRITDRLAVRRPSVPEPTPSLAKPTRMK